MSSKVLNHTSLCKPGISHENKLVKCLIVLLFPIQTHAYRSSPGTEPEAFLSGDVENVQSVSFLKSVKYNFTSTCCRTGHTIWITTRYVHSGVLKEAEGCRKHKVGQPLTSFSGYSWLKIGHSMMKKMSGQNDSEGLKFFIMLIHPRN